ncbi:poly-gamma-glutamate biosynthesis protein PgsC/CapC [Halolamina salina]|uniref:Poly-gamma-glutamate biosynthesis protein PgsC/CapC n=1 Tax=Halolamina salina TaxID=1220023 RepID=A0ABD6B645_9EURY
MIAASLVMIAGLGIVAFLSQAYGYRLGGVMVVPLLVIYTLREPLSPVIFVSGTAAAWCALWALREYTLNYGRRLFLAAVGVGAIATVAVGFVVSQLLPARLPFENAEVIASIFPGVTAYNLMRLAPENRRADLLAMAGCYAGLVAVGALSLVILARVGSPTPPVLALPTSDFVDWIGIDSRGTAHPPVTPNWLSVSLLLVDVAIYEGFRKRYDHRLAGIIIVPLLAVFSVRYGPAIAVYVIGATAVFFLLSYVHWVTLLYGRVLLALSLALGVLYVLVIGVLRPVSAPGITLFFVGLFVGIGAYNLHRVTPANRRAHIRISAALFAMFYATIYVLVDVPPSGLISDHPVPYALVGIVVVGLAAVELRRLEASIPDAAAFARESVFANVSVDGADIDDSPLVAETEEER